MKILADVIENFIISELLREHEDALLVQRNELAERLSCAPSQISYVLSTRFTPERGFMVGSRRGSGGFVRIVRMEPKNQLPKEPSAADCILSDENREQYRRQYLQRQMPEEYLPVGLLP